MQRAVNPALKSCSLHLCHSPASLSPKALHLMVTASHCCLSCGLSPGVESLTIAQQFHLAVLSLTILPFVCVLTAHAGAEGVKEGMHTARTRPPQPGAGPGPENPECSGALSSSASRLTRALHKAPDNVLLQVCMHAPVLNAWALLPACQPEDRSWCSAPCKDDQRVSVLVCQILNS